jgi:hypothetical protein
MAVRNLGWNSSNENRFFPFDDSATLLDDSGARPPLQLLSDLKIFVPRGLGEFVYLGAATISPQLVTLIFMASSDLELAGVVVGTISQQLPVNLHYPYQISQQLDGVGGWASFGKLNDILYQGKFSLPIQGLLSPVAARWIRTPPISSVRASGADPMAGLIKLSGGNDIEIVRECREVVDYDVPEYHESYCGPGLREVIVFRLKNKSSDETRNVLDLYSGPCAKRPGNRTCDNPQPIESIGPVSPDCDGNITIHLGGCLDVLAIRKLATTDEDGNPVLEDTTSGVILGCGLSLEDSCAQDRLPDADGRLPSEYDGLTESISSISEEASDPDPDFEFDHSEAVAGSISDELDIFSLSDDFTMEDDWVVRFGSFEVEGDTIQLGSHSRNTITFEPTGGTPSGFYKKATARVRLIPGSAGALHNASVIANVKTGFFAAEIDWDGQSKGYKLFRLARFDGSRWTSLTTTPATSLKLSDTYEISVSIYPHTDNIGGWLSGTLIGISNPAINLEIGPVFVSNYGPASGPFGIASNRSAAQFIEFRVESVTSAP